MESDVTVDLYICPLEHVQENYTPVGTTVLQTVAINCPKKMMHDSCKLADISGSHQGFIVRGGGLGTLCVTTVYMYMFIILFCFCRQLLPLQPNGHTNNNKNQRDWGYRTVHS